MNACTLVHSATLNDRSTVRSIYYTVRSPLDTVVVSAASGAERAMKISQFQIRLLLLSLACLGSFDRFVLKTRRIVIFRPGFSDLAFRT